LFVLAGLGKLNDFLVEITCGHEVSLVFVVEGDGIVLVHAGLFFFSGGLGVGLCLGQAAAEFL